VFVEHIRDLLQEDLFHRQDYGLVRQWQIFEGVNKDANISVVQILDKTGVAAYEIEVRRIGGTHE
jgi:hypothetical protein